MRARALLAVVAATLIWGCGNSDARDDLVVERDIRYAGPRGPLLDVYSPRDGREHRPAVLTIHGGSWRAGSRTDVKPTARALAGAGFVVFAPSYTLARPDRIGFPRQVRQMRAAVRFVRRNSGRFDVDPKRIGALGVSAGAHLAALLGTAARGPLDTGSRVRAVVSWSGPFDLRTLNLRRVLGNDIANFLGCLGCTQRAHRASPLAHASGDDPPMLIVNSALELIPVDQAQRMSMRLRASNVPARLLILQGNTHAPVFEPVVIRPTIRFLRRQLRRA